MSKERDLLKRCLRRFHKGEYECSQLVVDIELYLAEPEKKTTTLEIDDSGNLWPPGTKTPSIKLEVTKKLEPLSDEEIDAGYDYESVEHNVDSWWDFQRGIRFAEKHHGIGGEDADL